MMLPTSERYLGLLKLAARNSQQLLSPVPDPTCLNGFSFPGISELGISTRDAFDDLEQLAELGYVYRQFAERGYFCWQCGHHALLFREVCPSCTSSNVEVGDLLHHFRCGHTAPETEFQDGVRYTCRKCGHQLRHIGVDYERPASSYLCGSCNYVSTEPDTACLCLGCGQRFEAERAELRTIYAYRINARGNLALTRGELGDARGAGGLVDTEFGLYTFTYFDERLTQEVAASKRYKRPLSMMLVAFDPTEFAPGSQEIAQAMRHLVTGAKESLRDCDCAAMFREDCLAALLTDTDANGVPFALKRMQTAIDKITDAAGAARLVLQPGAVTLDESHPTARAFFDDARARLHRLQSGEPVNEEPAPSPPPPAAE